jgi:hypothetical protein
MDFNCINFLVIFLLLFSIVNCSDQQCCKKKKNCYNCDSRVDDKCGDSFNSTGVTTEGCEDFCAKIKYKYGSSFYYIRTCAENLKKISIKKTEVCYSARAKTDGNLCFCDGDLCNSANTPSVESKTFIILFSILFLFYNYIGDF